MVDFKRLVTGFLIFAAATGSLSFVFSNYYAPTTATPLDEAQINPAFQNPPPPTSNAFVEPVPDSKQQFENIAAPSGRSAGTGDQFSAANPSNLTDSLTKNLLQDLIAANPQGPLDANGQVKIAQPDIDALMNKVAKEPAIKKLRIPDWKAEAGALKLTVIDNPSKDDIERYNGALENIFDTYFIQSNLTSLVGPQSGLADFGRPAEIIGNAIEAAKTMPTPRQFTDLQRSGLTLLSYAHNALLLAKDAAADPLKPALILQAQETNYKLAVQNFKNEYLKAKNSGILSESKEPSGLLATVNSIFGVKTAHAQYPTWDFPSFSDFLLTIIDDLKNALLTQLKQMVIQRVLNNVVGFIQGNGNGQPLFITNWKGFLQSTFQTLAGVTINEIAPGLCRSFGSLVQVNLQRAYLDTGPSPIIGCSLDRIVGNIKAFYLNFQTGGWIAFGAQALPSGNYFGSSFWGGQEVARKAQQSANALKNEGIASRGFLSVKKCPAEYPNKTAFGQCQNDFIDATTGIPNPNFKSVDPYNKTPGGAVADSLFAAMKDTTEPLTNTDFSWAAIFASFVGNVIDAAFTRGIQNLAGAARF